MIFDFPSIKQKTNTIKNIEKTCIKRDFWLRIIWYKTQKTIIIGKWLINIEKFNGK
jgi:hypothetical protein